ncbi:PAS domain S-box protein [Flavobacterium sp. DG1-102-2]|uniref:PAS domain S-box protein n=1 Tax=Flavobacterium sp. DG1-102-2 TaxID=3081663 RepID=UPI002948CDE0|nr:PAS domain S-box protein [Flavobacterium sp. DG1-102-2]MDV6167426.1 PAS domain S-box protein [Flavobacterium sp. DG1-102-2]
MKHNSTQYPYLQGGGEMGELTRNYDWSSTVLGPIEQWPLSLRNTVSMILSSKFPMFLFWGPDHIQFYNDAYRPSLGSSGKHPMALGQKGVDCWPEIWDTINPLMVKVLNGEDGVWFEDLYLPIYRNGQLEDAYWTFSYSSVYGDTGTIEGILVICNETTEKLNVIKHLEDGRNELEFAIDAAELGVWDFNPNTWTFSGNTRLKEWFGLRHDEYVNLDLATSVIAEEDRERVNAAIAFAMQYESGGIYDTEYTIIHPVTKYERIVRAKGRAWFNGDNKAYRFNGTLQDITESRKAEQKIAEANHLNDLILKSAGIGLFRVDLLTGHIEYSPSFAAIVTGNPEKKEISRKVFSNYVHPEDRAEREAALIEGAKTNEFYYSPRVIWDDGTIHRIHVMGTNTLDANGKPLIFSGTVRDITMLEDHRVALEKAETQQHESDAMFRTVTDSSPTGLWLSDTNGIITYVNKAMIEWTGLSYQEYVSGDSQSSIYKEDRQKCADAFALASATKSHYNVIFRLNKVDGTTLWCRAGGDPYYNSNGDFEGYAGYCMDINEIMQSRKALLDSEERFRSMIDQAPIATCLFTGLDMKVEVANDLMLNLWGSDSSVIGKPLSEAVPELKGQPFLDILKEVYTTGIPYQMNAAPAQLKLGGVFGTYYFDFTYQPVFDVNGNVYGVMDMAIDVTAQVLAQQRVKESQQQILDSFEQAPVGIAVLSGKGLIFTMANPFYGELVGRKPEEIIGKTLMTALPELEGQGFDKLLENVIITGIPYAAKEVAVTLLRNNNLDVIYVDLTYQPMYDRDRNVVGVLVVATDVTQQVHSRNKVEMSEAKLRSIIATAPAGMGLFVGRDLIVEMPNQTFIDIVGKGWDIVGKPLREAMPELITHGQPFLKILDDVYTTGKMYQSYGDQVIIIQNGVTTYNYYNITYTPVFDENNEVYAILDIAIDVTDAVMARQKAENTGVALRGAIELAGLATWRFNIKDDTFTYSQRFMDWLGFSEETASIDQAYNPLPADYVELVDDAIRAAIAQGSNGIYDNEHPIINRVTGQIRIIHAQAQVTYDSAGNPEFLTGSAQDVTKERKLQQELEFQVKQRTEELQAANNELAGAINALQQNNTELQQFAYIASHDLQEPTRKISIFAKMLMESLGAIDDRSKTYLKKINISADRMSDLISDILAYSQLSKDNSLVMPVDLNKVLKDAVTDFELVIEQTGAVIDFEELPVVEAIPRQMSQLFSNLISNSLKYRRANVNPVINITVNLLPVDEGSADDTLYYRFDFTDNGIGFSQEYADKIFNIFQRLHGKSEYSGTGIGLSICKKIVQNHHGFIEAKGNEGHGAAFIITLPAKQNFAEE